MRIELRPRTALAILVVVLVVILTGSAVAAEFTDTDWSADADIDMVVLQDGSQLWAYTSRAPNVNERTLSINVVVYGNADATERLLREQAVGDWKEVEEDEQDIAPAEEFDTRVNETTTAWGTADGAVRYVYVQPLGENGGEQPDGLWLTESYQLSDGDYLGSRHHIRAYNDPVNGDWTAMQAHFEHWDWFHLRHTVHSIEESQSYVEAEFIDRWYTESLHRDRFGNDESSDADGWVTIVKLNDGAIAFAMTLLLASSLGAVDWRRRFDRLGNQLSTLRTDDSVLAGVRAFSVVVALVALFTTVRFGAIGLERFSTGVNPKAIVALFYPLLIVGMPIAAYLLSRQLNSAHAFTAASVGFTVATFIDYTYLGVLTLPIDTFVHRATLAVAIGFIAAGASKTARTPDSENGLVRTGVLLWFVAVTVPLLQFV